MDHEFGGRVIVNPNQRKGCRHYYDALRARGAMTRTDVVAVIAIAVVVAGLTTCLLLLPSIIPNYDPSPIRQQMLLIENAVADFKDAYGEFPPNLELNAVQSEPRQNEAIAQQDLRRMFELMFPRSLEPESLILGLVGISAGSDSSTVLPEGLSASESLFFWLGGFSDDPQYPLSGPGGPSFTDADGNNDGILDARDERVEARNPLYRFDLNRIGPKTEEGFFDDREVSKFSGRFIEYDDPRSGVRRRINFWRYYPLGSSEPFAYFDTSRHLPAEYFPRENPELAGGAAPLMMLSNGASSAAAGAEDFIYANQGSFQLLHAGMDDVWGEFRRIREGSVVFPDGPFVGDIADTVTNFTSDTFQNAQQYEH